MCLGVIYKLVIILRWNCLLLKILKKRSDYYEFVFFLYNNIIFFIFLGILILCVFNIYVVNMILICCVWDLVWKWYCVCYLYVCMFVGLFVYLRDVKKIFLFIIKVMFILKRYVMLIN